MKVLTAPTAVEMVVKKSRFLSEAIPVESAEKAREIWRSQKLKYDNGGHIVFAFAVGATGGVLGCSDDGEPAGTAGRPTLEVVKNCGITNLIVTTARWYGGIKLGTGGLVKAYTEAAQFALENASTRDLQSMTHLNFALPYSLIDQTKKELDALSFELFNESYAENITLAGRMPENNLETLKKFLQDSSKGSIILNIEKTVVE